MHTIRTKKRTCDCAKEYTHVDFIQSSAIYMEAQINVSYQLRTLLPDLVNERINTNTCNKPSPSFCRKYVVRQMIFSTHCIVLKITYDTRGLPYFLTCEVNIMPFFLLGSRQGLGVSLNSHISVMNYLLVLPLRGDGFNKLVGSGYFWKWKSSLHSYLERLCQQGVKIKDFQKDRMFFI